MLCRYWYLSSDTQQPPKELDPSMSASISSGAEDRGQGISDSRACLAPASLQVHGTEPQGSKVERGSGTPNASSGLCVYTHMHTYIHV